QQALEQPAALLPATGQAEIVGKPEAAGKEDPFASRQAVTPNGCVISPDEAVLHEMGPDRLDCAENAWVLGREKSHQRDQQSGSIDVLGPVALDEGPALRIEAQAADLPVKIVAKPAPMAGRSRQPEMLD